MGAGPSITSNISVSNLMLRCEWILKQAGEAPGEACVGPPGPAAGLNKYAAEQTCRQLGPDMAAAVCVVALLGRWGERAEESPAACSYHVSWEKWVKKPEERNKWNLKTRLCAMCSCMCVGSLWDLMVSVSMLSFSAALVNSLPQANPWYLLWFFMQLYNPLPLISHWPYVYMTCH